MNAAASYLIAPRRCGVRERRDDDTVRRVARVAGSQHTNGAMPARFVDRVTSIDGETRYLRISVGDEPAGVRVISATRGGRADQDENEVFEEEVVDGDEEILIHFADDRVSRVQERFREAMYLERAEGEIEANAWCIRVDEAGTARLEHRSKTVRWSWRGEDDGANVEDVRCRLVESDDVEGLVRARMAVISRVCGLRVAEDGAPMRTFFRRHDKDWGVILATRASRANVGDVTEQGRQALQPFTIVTSRRAFVDAVTSSGLSPLRTGAEALMEAEAWSLRNDDTKDGLSMRIGSAGAFLLNVEPEALVVDSHGQHHWLARSGARFGGDGAGVAAMHDNDEDDNDEEDEEDEEGDVNGGDEGGDDENCAGLSDDTRVIAMSHGGAVVKTLGAIQPGDYLAANLSEGGEVSQWVRVMDVIRRDVQTAIKATLLHIDDADDIMGLCCGNRCKLNLTAPAQRVSVDPARVTRYARPFTLTTWNVRAGEYVRSYTRIVLRTRHSSAPDYVTAHREMAMFIAAARIHVGPNAATIIETRQALILQDQGQEVWRTNFGPRFHARFYVDDIASLNARIREANHVPAAFATAGDVLRRDAEKRAAYEQGVARYEATAPQLRVLLSGDSFVLGGEAYARKVLAQVEIAASRFAEADGPNFEQVVRRITPLEPEDAARWLALWLGDGCKRTLHFAVAKSEEIYIAGFLHEIAHISGYALHIYGEDQNVATYAYVNYDGSHGERSPLRSLLETLNIFQDKVVSGSTLRLFLSASRATRLALLAGFGDTDGWRWASRGMSAVGFSQSLRAGHGSIVMTYAVVAASCGFDVAYSEKFSKDRPPLRDDDQHEDVWQARGFPRFRECLAIINGATSAIPFLLDQKRPPVDRVIDGELFVRGFSGFQFKRIRGAAISMTTLTVRGSDRIVLANGIRMPVHSVNYD